MSVIKPLIDTLPFIKFSDRAVGNRFKAALESIDKDFDELERLDQEYEPGSEAEAALEELAKEVEDAVEHIEEDEELEEKKHQLEAQEAEDKEDEIVVELEEDEENEVIDLDAEEPDPSEVEDEEN